MHERKGAYLATIPKHRALRTLDQVAPLLATSVTLVHAVHLGRKLLDPVAQGEQVIQGRGDNLQVRC